MSTTSRADANSIRAVRGLLERNLLDRAVALAETRWPGSGPVVELAHEWAALSPGVRRERLAAIGPDDLARLRGLAQIQPDLARVLSDLEARGILPPESAVQIGQAPAVATTPQQTFQEAVVDAALDYTEQGAQLLARSAQEQLPPRLQASLDGADALDAAAIAAVAANVARQRAAVEALPDPDLDLGLPSAEEFLSEEAERRREANEAANRILERARSKVDDAADRLLNTPSPTPLAPAVQPEPQITAIAPVESAPPIEPQSTRVDSQVDEELQQRIEREQVLILDEIEDRPTVPQLRSVANAAKRPYVELDRNALDARAFFGGLVREGRHVEPRAGEFPTAVSQRQQVVVHGRILPKTIERLREGYCDIPGTQATVRVHPDCRIIIIPE